MTGEEDEKWSGFVSQDEKCMTSSWRSADVLFWKDFVSRIIHLFIPASLGFSFLRAGCWLAELEVKQMDRTENSLYPVVNKTVWDGDPAPPSTPKCTALTEGTGLGRSSGKVSLGWCFAPFVIPWSSNNCSKASQTPNQFKACFWYLYFLSALDCAVSLSREGEWQMSGRSWEYPHTLNWWNDPRFCWFSLYEQFLFEDGLVWPRVTSWALPLLLPWEINLWKSAKLHCCSCGTGKD